MQSSDNGQRQIIDAEFARNAQGGSALPGSRERKFAIHRRNFLLAATALIGALSFAVVARAGNEEPAATANPPAVVEPIEGTSINRVTLTEKAAERLAIQTAPAREEQV